MFSWPKVSGFAIAQICRGREGRSISFLSSKLVKQDKTLRPEINRWYKMQSRRASSDWDLRLPKIYKSFSTDHTWSCCIPWYEVVEKCQNIFLPVILFTKKKGQVSYMIYNRSVAQGYDKKSTVLNISCNIVFFLTFKHDNLPHAIPVLHGYESRDGRWSREVTSDNMIVRKTTIYRPG